MLEISSNSKKFFFIFIFLFSFKNLNASNPNDQQKKNSEQMKKNDNLEIKILEQIKDQIEDLSQKVSKLSTEVEEIKYERDVEKNNEINSNSFSSNQENKSKQNSGPNFAGDGIFSGNENEFDVLYDSEENDYQNTSSSSKLSSTQALSLKDKNHKIEGGQQIENLYIISIEKFRTNSYEESQALLEKIINTSWGGDPEKNSEIKANSYFLMGEIFYKKPDFEKASSNFLKAYQVFSKINKNHIQAGNSLLRLGQTLYASGNKDAACKSFLKLNSDFKSIENSLIEISENEINQLKCLN